jgi:formylglycine-generating enzyme required for sulfatase activity
LSWICTHPNGDTLTYDIYFGTSSNPSLVNIGQTENYYDPGDLIDEMTYFWKIKAYDDDLNSTTSDIWEFTTTSVSDFDWCDVTAGEYTYGSSSQILEIDYNFQIMKYEVTNNQYLVYIESALNAGQIFVTSSSVEGHYVGDQHFSEGLYEFLDLNSIYCKIEWNGNSFNVISGYENHPVVEVSWFGSWAFAEFYDFRLPTEYEWEKAARGNTGYCWPWGNDIVIGRANFEGDGDPFEENEVATTPVGFYNGQIFQGFATIDSPSPYGAYDIAGNVIEWTDSWWSVNLTTYRVYRSGSWTSSPYMCYCFDRWGANPSSSSWTTGFRCVFQ